MGTAWGPDDALTCDCRPYACHDLDVMAIDRLRRQPEVYPESLRNYRSRPGLDPGTLGAILPDPGTFLDVQICWSNEVGRSPTFSEMFPSLIHWLDDWLDKTSYTGLANVRFKSSGGEVVELRFGID